MRSVNDAIVEGLVTYNRGFSYVIIDELVRNSSVVIKDRKKKKDCIAFKILIIKKKI